MRTALILAGLMLSLAAEPQEIYRWVDKDGVVHYADQPGAPDAKRVEIAVSNSYEATPPGAGEPSTPSRGPAPILYDSLTITQPSPDQVFFGADATVTAAAELGGSLEPGHTLVFYLDGNQVPAEGGGSAQLSNLYRGTHFLRAAVLDENGAPLISSGQIPFHVRMPSINSPQSPQAPKPPKPAPKPKPAT
ncbi:MAG: DUF4124 domain-containing protein [Steroidobacteraceae bacterium]